MLDSDEEEEEAEAEAKSAEAKSEEGGAAAKPAERPDLPPSDSEESSSDEDVGTTSNLSINKTKNQF